MGTAFLFPWRIPRTPRRGSSHGSMVAARHFLRCPACPRPAQPPRQGCCVPQPWGPPPLLLGAGEYLHPLPGVAQPFPQGAPCAWLAPHLRLCPWQLSVPWQPSVLQRGGGLWCGDRPRGARGGCRMQWRGRRALGCYPALGTPVALEPTEMCSGTRQWGSAQRLVPVHVTSETSWTGSVLSRERGGEAEPRSKGGCSASKRSPGAGSEGAGGRGRGKGRQARAKPPLEAAGKERLGEGGTLRKREPGCAGEMRGQSVWESREATLQLEGGRGKHRGKEEQAGR